MGLCGMGGTVGSGSKPSGLLWLIGNSVGIVPVARAYAHATAAITGATANSPAPPGDDVVAGNELDDDGRDVARQGPEEGDL